MKRLLKILMIGLGLASAVVITMVVSPWVASSEKNKILIGHNFDVGDWLLVNVNYAQNTLQLIDDERVLQDYQNGIWIRNAGDCMWTTCDGFLILYKDGHLITEVGYLSRSKLYESSEIEKSYRNGVEWYIEATGELEFKQVWDSLLIAESYPTIEHSQSDEQDIIKAYRIEALK